MYFHPEQIVDEYFQRKQKQTEPKSKRKPTRRDLKNLSHLLRQRKKRRSSTCYT